MSSCSSSAHWREGGRVGCDSPQYSLKVERRFTGDHANTVQWKWRGPRYDEGCHKCKDDVRSAVENSILNMTP
eukprot:9605567-Karenia_brevis.AAC.1